MRGFKCGNVAQLLQNCKIVDSATEKQPKPTEMGVVGTGSPGHVAPPPLTYSLTANQKGGVETLINMLYDRWARLRHRVEHILLPCFGLSAMF